MLILKSLQAQVQTPRYPFNGINNFQRTEPLCSAKTRQRPDQSEKQLPTSGGDPGLPTRSQGNWS